MPTSTDDVPTTGIAFRTIAEDHAGGPALTDDPDETGLHLRRFVAYTDATDARAALGALDWSDGADRRALADVLEREGGTLIGLYPGRQPSQGAIGTSVADVSIEDDRLVVILRMTTSLGCFADEALGAPYRIVHVEATAPEVTFREAIVPCEARSDAPPNEVSDLRVTFTGETSAVIDWSAPSRADDATRYDVVSQDGEPGTDVYDGVDAPRYEVTGLVPGLVRTYRILPVGPVFDTDRPRGRQVALIVDAPSALFKGRVSLEDFYAQARSLAGPDAVECGESGADGTIDAAVTTACAETALAAGRPFVRTTRRLGEGLSIGALVGNADGDAWLLDFDLSDIALDDPFAPSEAYGGRLTGRPCAVPVFTLAGHVLCDG